MSEFIYNTHDLPLVITIGQCLLLICILILTRKHPATGNGLLALLVLSFGINALDTIAYWNTNLKAMVAEWGVWPFWVLKWVPLVQGPLLFVYVRTRIAGEPMLFRRDWPHLMLPLFGVMLLAAVFVSMSEADRLAGVDNWGRWLRAWEYKAVFWLNNLASLAYGGLALKYLRANHQQLENHYSDPNASQPLWLHVVILGFLGLWGWSSIQSFAGVMGLIDLTEFMGISGNYFKFIYVNALVFVSLLKSHVIVAMPESPNEPDTDMDTDNQVYGDAEVAQSLKQLLLERELYLNPELTLTELGAIAGIDARKASEIINEHLQESFFELVNLARVERAKALLYSTRLPINHVFRKSGFNSKATFNRIFKRFERSTPTDYRRVSQYTPEGASV